MFPMKKASMKAPMKLPMPHKAPPFGKAPARGKAPAKLTPPKLPPRVAASGGAKAEALAALHKAEAIIRKMK